MDELLLYDNIDLKHLNHVEIEDFDSGCSSGPSSPSNLSDFSGSSYEDFNDNLMLTRKDAFEMGQSVLSGGPVINPYIKIKTDDQVDSDFYPADCLLSGDNDLLGMMLNGVDVLREDCYTFDAEDTSIAKVVVEKLEPIENIMDVEEHPAQSTNLKSSRKRNLRNRNSSCSDHNYAQELDEVDESDKNATVPANVELSYAEKRRKNNLAAKKSRQLKRAKEIENIKRCEKLKKENNSLQKELKKLQSLVSKLEVKLKAR